jgi:trans-aconitate methyltransferase
VTDRAHWEDRYRSVAAEELSWFQPAATTSLELLDTLGVDAADSVIDIGGGTSPLCGDLLARGVADVTVLDVSQQALDIAARRITSPDRVQWLVADVRAWHPARTWSVWHDRAMFHFLTTDDERDAYLDTMSQALASDGAFVIATFAPDGPDHCSGLPTRRYDAPTLVAAISTRIDAELVTDARHVHVTPSGVHQAFTWIACRRRG